jgi:DNA-binding PadR family transcriptional regulator
MLKYVLLGGLSYRPLTGYELKQFVDNTAKHFWYAQTSQIYRTLKELEDEGAVTSHIEAQAKRPDKRLYHITPQGIADLDSWLIQPMTAIEPTKDALIVRLFFARRMKKADLLTQLRLQRALHQEQLQRYRTEIRAQIEQAVAQNPQVARDTFFWELSRRNGELMEEAYIRWLDEVIARVEADDEHDSL